MLKRHLIVSDPGGARASVVMACGKKGRIRMRYEAVYGGRTNRFVEGDTWKGEAIAPTGFAAEAEGHFYPDLRTRCAKCIAAYNKMT